MVLNARYIRSDASNNPVDEIYALVRTVYPEDKVLNPCILNTWFSANYNIFWLAYSENMLVGYLSIIPLEPTKFKQLYKPNFDEKTIFASDVIPSFDDATNFLLSSIVVHQDYRKQS